MDGIGPQQSDSVGALPRRESPNVEFGGPRRLEAALTFAPGMDRIGAADVSAIAGGDLGNVIPFVRAGRKIGGSAPPLSAAARPAPALQTPRDWLIVALFCLSMVAHAALLTFGGREPPPLASVGIETINVELVLGADKAAGLATQPSAAEAPVDAAPAPDQGQDLAPPQAAHAANRDPQPESDESPRDVAAAETQTLLESPDLVPSQDRGVPETTDRPVTSQAPLVMAVATAKESVPPPPESLLPEPEKPIATEKPRENRTPVEAKKPPVARHQALPVRHDADDGDNERRRRSRQSTASTASSGIGIGRSDAVSNYRGLVSAQLARHKQFPDEARRNGEHGSAVISFTIGASGSVTGVRLIRSAGAASLDREAQAMARRASPFPPPPGGHSMNFTVPVSFHLR